MADIVHLAAPKVRIWICDCGCSTFNLVSDGSAICANCEADHEGAGAGWLDRCESRQTRHAETEVFSDLQGNGSIEFARRRIAHMAAGDDVAMIVIARDCGSISTWSKAETVEQDRWMRRKLKQAGNLFKRRAPTHG